MVRQSKQRRIIVPYRNLFIFLGLVGCAGTALATDPNLARNLAASCTGCHGTNGYSAGGNASLAGRSEQQLMQTLGEFRRGEKPAFIMHQITRGYSEEQLQLISAWFAAREKE